MIPELLCLKENRFCLVFFFWHESKIDFYTILHKHCHYIKWNSTLSYNVLDTAVASCVTIRINE